MSLSKHMDPHVVALMKAEGGNVLVPNFRVHQVETRGNFPENLYLLDDSQRYFRCILLYLCFHARVNPTAQAMLAQGNVLGGIHHAFKRVRRFGCHRFPEIQQTFGHWEKFCDSLKEASDRVRQVPPYIPKNINELLSKCSSFAGIFKDAFPVLISLTHQTAILQEKYGSVNVGGVRVLDHCTRNILNVCGNVLSREVSLLNELANVHATNAETSEHKPFMFTSLLNEAKLQLNMHCPHLNAKFGGLDKLTRPQIISIVGAKADKHGFVIDNETDPIGLLGKWQEAVRHDVGFGELDNTQLYDHATMSSIWQGFKFRVPPNMDTFLNHENVSAFTCTEAYEIVNCFEAHFEHKSDPIYYAPPFYPKKECKTHNVHIVVTGDENAGKSTFLQRLKLAAYAPVPKTGPEGACEKFRLQTGLRGTHVIVAVEDTDGEKFKQIAKSGEMAAKLHDQDIMFTLIPNDDPTRSEDLYGTGRKFKEHGGRVIGNQKFPGDYCVLITKHDIRTHDHLEKKIKENAEKDAGSNVVYTSSKDGFGVAAVFVKAVEAALVKIPWLEHKEKKISLKTHSHKYF